MKSKSRKAQTVVHQNKGDVGGASLPKIPSAFVAGVMLVEEEVEVVLNLQSACDKMRELPESGESLDFGLRKRLGGILALAEDFTYDVLYECSTPVSMDKQGRVERPKLGSRMWYMPQSDKTT